MTTPTLYRRALEDFGRRVEAIDESQWDQPVPCCPDFDVRGLVRHVTEEAAWTPPLLEGRDPDQVGQHIEEDLTNDHPREVWERSARAASDAVQDPGALEGTVQTSRGEVGARDYLSEVFADTLIHTWDLAQAIGSDDRLDPEAVDACASWFDTMEDKWREGGAVGPPVEVSPDADPQTRLLARFGRQS
jgi:uncharacterized protein (TIGR03086 family)